MSLCSCVITLELIGGEIECKRSPLHLETAGENSTWLRYNISGPEEIQREADAQIPLEKIHSDWPVGTDPNLHIKKVTELFESGVTIVNVHAGQKDQQRVIDFFGKEVLPKLRGRKVA